MTCECKSEKRPFLAEWRQGLERRQAAFTRLGVPDSGLLDVLEEEARTCVLDAVEMALEVLLEPPPQHERRLLLRE